MLVAFRVPRLRLVPETGIEQKIAETLKGILSFISLAIFCSDFVRQRDLKIELIDVVFIENKWWPEQDLAAFDHL